ncbi:hypothetical protein Bca101_045880 [Brassica carinata]
MMSRLYMRHFFLLVFSFDKLILCRLHFLMANNNEEHFEDSNSNGGDTFDAVNQRFKDRSKKVVHTRELLSKQAVQTREILSKQAVKIAKQAEEHERFINKVTHLVGVLGFGGFCFLLGARPQDIPLVYCFFYVIFVPLRWDFCYYANTIFLVDLLLYPKNEKLFMVCFSFAEGPLAWALIVWRCSLVFSSPDKIVSVLIHLLPGLVFFTIRWWNPATFAAMRPTGTDRRVSWPYVEGKSYLFTWLFLVPLVVYTLWQVLYFLIVNVLRRQRLLRDPEVMTSYRELSKKAQKANNKLWQLSGVLGDQNRMWMYILFQAIFTVATMALTILKISAAVWNGGSFLLEVMPRQVNQKEKKKGEMHPIGEQPQSQHERTGDSEDWSEILLRRLESPLAAPNLVESISEMNGDRPDSHYTETGFPYAAASSASYMDFYGGGAAQEPLNYAHSGTMHPQDSLYWTMNTNAYKFGFSGSSDNASSFYGSYDMNDHLSRMSIGRTNWEYLPMVNVDESVPRSVHQIGGDTDDHSGPEECIAIEHDPESPQVSWQDDIDPDTMTYEELIELGEAVGSESRGLSQELIETLPTRKYKLGSFFSRKRAGERCVICQLKYKIGEKQMNLPCKHVYHSECISKWLSINKICPVCNSEVFGDPSIH